MTMRQTSIGRRKRSFFRCLSFIRGNLFSWRQDTNKLCMQRSLFFGKDFDKYMSSYLEIFFFIFWSKYFDVFVIKNLFFSFFSVINHETSSIQREYRSDIVFVWNFEKWVERISPEENKGKDKSPEKLGAKEFFWFHKKS